jgi:prepilin-type N-terminal cleavage/methylation domain-containing protein
MQIYQQLNQNSRSGGTRAGFTLIELMVVIMIIGIVSGVVLTAMGTGNQARKVDVGIVRMHSLFSLARSAAISRQQTTRVIIHFDPGIEDRFLQYATIVYEEEEDSGDIVWKLYTEGISLPGGVYFSPALSSTSDNPLFVWELELDENLIIQNQPASRNMVNAGAATLSGGRDRDPLNFSEDPGENKWIAYEFNPNGTFGTPESTPLTKPPPLSRAVLVSAIALSLPGDPELLFQKEGESDITDSAKGFVIFRSGRALHFQSGEQINEGNS